MLQQQLEQQSKAVDTIIGNMRVRPAGWLQRRLPSSARCMDAAHCFAVPPGRVRPCSSALASFLPCKVHPAAAPPLLPSAGSPKSNNILKAFATFSVLSSQVLENKLAEAKMKKDTLKARAQSAKSARAINDMVRHHWLACLLPAC